MRKRLRILRKSIAKPLGKSQALKHVRSMILRPANTIADAILAKAAKQGITMSNLKLQKLLYYVQGYHLARLGTVAFNDQIKAWSHGPVVPVVYHRFKKYTWMDIKEIPEAPKLSEKTDHLIDKVLARLGGFSGIELEDMTHAEPTWIEARGDNPIGSTVSPEITTKSLRAYFAKAAL